MICKNCGHKFEGNYCNNCGQKSNVGNINFKNTINDVLNGLFQIDKGFFFTIKELFIRPGNSIKQYIEGKRKKYFNPFSYIIICSLIFILINYFTTYETSLFKFTNGFVEGVPKGGPKNTIILLEKIFEWLTTHYAYTILILLPVFSLSSFFSFKKYGYN